MYNSEQILGKIEESVINDYFTGSVKAEVSLDMLLTPVIANILNLTLCPDYNNRLRYITKEFPMVTGKSGLRSAKADYLLCDNNYVYLVELKTSIDSVDTAISDKKGNDTQLGKYKKLINKPFFQKDSDEFQDIGSGYINVLEAHCKSELEELYHQNILSDIFYEKKEVPEVDINYIRKTLKEKSLRGTKKYITQTHQILTGESLVDKKIKVLYLMPSKLPNNDYFKEICSGAELESLNEDVVGVITFDCVISACEDSKDDYINWLTNNILNKLF